MFSCQEFPKSPKPVVLVLLVVVALSQFCPIASATTWTITSTADDGSVGTLRYAIANASSGDTVNITATGTIILTPPTYSWQINAIVITTNLTITGPGALNLTISGPTSGNGTPIFWVNSGNTVSISGLTLANGNNQNYEGGAIRVAL